MIFFTGDQHFGHRNIIRLCARPFESVEQMDAVLIERWNRKVTNGDTVYILGDLMFRNEKPPEEYLRQLRGKKHLIVGNHDGGWMKQCDLTQWFTRVEHLLFTSDGKCPLTLCHYPMISWPHMAKCYMVYGHIHGNTDANYWPLLRDDPRMLNAGVDVNGYEPVTFDEMVKNNLRHRAGSTKYRAGADAEGEGQ